MKSEKSTKFVKNPIFFQKLMGPNMTQAEGFVLGLGAKLFTIAGPVIVYGTVASVLYGVVYWILQLI